MAIDKTQNVKRIDDKVGKLETGNFSNYKKILQINSIMIIQQIMNEHRSVRWKGSQLVDMWKLI